MKRPRIESFCAPARNSAITSSDTAIERALRNSCPSRSASAACNGSSSTNLVVAPDFAGCRSRWPSLTGAGTGPVIDDARDQPLAAGLRHHDRHRTRGLQRHAAVGAADRPWRCRASAPSREQHALLEIAEAPFQQLLGVVGAFLGGLGAVDHDDQPQAVLHRRADQTVAGLLGEAGLQAVGAGDACRAADCGSAGGSCSR